MCLKNFSAKNSRIDPSKVVAVVIYPEVEYPSVKCHVMFLFSMISFSFKDFFFKFETGVQIEMIEEKS